MNGNAPWFSDPGWKVHGWRYPVVWWARRKPRSALRQWLWNRVDNIAWRQTMRQVRKSRAASSQEGTEA